MNTPRRMRTIGPALRAPLDDGAFVRLGETCGARCRSGCWSFPGPSRGPNVRIQRSNLKLNWKLVSPNGTVIT